MKVMKVKEKLPNLAVMCLFDEDERKNKGKVNLNQLSWKCLGQVGRVEQL
jgi:hypothetical protein